MSKKSTSGTIRIENTAKTHVPDGVLEALNPRAMLLLAGDIIKANIADEVVFVGPVVVSNATHVLVDGGAHSFDKADVLLLTPDELARYAAVTQQTTLGMGNIIDAVVNGGAE